VRGDDPSSIQRTEHLMTMYGANPEQLTNLGSTLNRQIDTISQVMSTVDGVLNATAWTGPARDQFVEDWNGSFKQALGRLNEAFGLAGRDCISMSDELRRLLGARG
jgi:uncharacterized protein YukE